MGVFGGGTACRCHTATFCCSENLGNSLQSRHNKRLLSTQLMSRAFIQSKRRTQKKRGCLRERLRIRFCACRIAQISSRLLYCIQEDSHRTHQSITSQRKQKCSSRHVRPRQEMSQISTVFLTHPRRNVMYRRDRRS